MQRRTPSGALRFLLELAAVASFATVLLVLLIAAQQDAARSDPGVEQSIPEFGMEVLTRPPRPLPDDVGPDWAVVQEYLDAELAWRERSREAAMAGGSADEMGRRMQALFGERPDIRRAIAAASAIVDAGGHDGLMEAAEFLLKETQFEEDGRVHMSKGARVLLAHAPEKSLQTLRSLHERMFLPQHGQGGDPVQALFEEVAFDAQDPMTRAAARYFLAVELMREANSRWWPLPPERREAARQRGIEVATGLGTGVEDEEFAGLDDPGPFMGRARTFAQAETDLLYGLRHATIGGTVAEVTGRRLDGVEDRLSAYAGKVVLVDFWATWCKPCVDVLPELRELVAELPADRFTLLAISVDEEPETVTAFQEREPMPWTNWHVGRASGMVRNWFVSAFPTYVLIDGQGRILARGWLDEQFKSLLREAVESS